MKTVFYIKSNDVVFFKRWQNRGFSILNSLKKIVIILVLPIIYIAGSFNYAYSQTDTVNISGIIINSQNKTVFANKTSKVVNIITSSQIRKIPANNFSDLLDGTLGVDFSQRGADDVQADISIRGGSFDQTLILLNGVPISDPQTGHNSFSVPIPLQLVDRIEILQGSGTRLYGLGAYSGAINIVSKSQIPHFFSLNFEYGQNFSPQISVLSSFTKNKWSTSVSVMAKHSDGYFTNTDFSIGNLFFNEVYEQNNFKIALQTSVSAKKYGAYNFYTPNFPYQFEMTGKIFSAINVDLGDNLRNKFSLFYNIHKDRFELFREDDNWYQHIGNYWIKADDDTAKYVQNVYQNWAYYPGHNYHLTQTVGFSYGSYFSSQIGITNYGVNVQYNKIISTVLGNDIDTVFLSDIAFSKGDERINYCAFLDHKFYIGNLSVSGGTSIIYNKFFGFFTTLGADVNYRINKVDNVYLSVNQGVRMPTFTDLYYSGPTNVGNADLKPEKSTTYEFGNKFHSKNISSQIAVFYRNGKNSIDWVKFKDDTKWHTLNYTELNTFGVEIATKINFTSHLIDFISVDYTYLYQQKPSLEATSKYAMNYLKHNLLISANHKIISNLDFNWRLRFLDRNGTYFVKNNANDIEMDFAPYSLLDAKISYKFKFATFYVQASNILNTDYYDLSYIKLPGRMFFIGLNLEW